MGLPLRKTEQTFTYGDYRAWGEGESWELIDGTAWCMAPAPTSWHQVVLTNLLRPLLHHFSGRSCLVLPAPFDVRLAEGDEADDAIRTVVQPDISVVCDRSRIDSRGCRGAPDWIIEIISPSTAFKDQGIKRELYERHGVREYWLVWPTERTIAVYRLTDGAYGKPAIYGEEDSVTPGDFPDLAIAMAGLFEGVPEET